MKLSKKQQEVVDKMREGWEMWYAHISQRYWLRKAGKNLNIASITAKSLIRQRIIEHVSMGINPHQQQYQLTKTMRDKILKMLHNYIYQGPSKTILGRVIASERIEQLICYREVLALFYIIKPVSNLEISNFETTCLAYLKSDYPEQTILQAIEKVKSEVK
jgi:hypothetical protein